MTATPAHHVTRLVEAKPRFGQLCELAEPGLRFDQAGHVTGRSSDAARFIVAPRMRR
ncbi:unnamed protein product [Ectocarpus sp. CCAP 1310/34]|nr:unnamed protein product [Ectocarpus sp. CCAP 1310/34]